METPADGSGMSKSEELKSGGEMGFGEEDVKIESLLKNEDKRVKERTNSDDEELGEADDIDEDEEGSEEEEEGRVFAVGDFVWGKIRHHPWWPGQIYDASDASELALKHKVKDKKRYLVAYFGDGTFSWCSGSQLKRFDEDFQALSHQSSSKSFVLAVEDVLSVIGEIVALEMKDGQVEVDRPVAENAGIKKGVLVPMVGVDRLSVANFNAVEIIASVKNAARTVFKENRLELVVLTSKLSAFYRAKGYAQLQNYHYPEYIVGLEDPDKVDVDAAASDGGIVQSSYDDGQRRKGDSSQKMAVISEDKLYERRKQKSLADIIREETDTEETPSSKQGTKRRKRIGQTDVHEKDSVSSLVKGKKKAKMQKTDGNEGDSGRDDMELNGAKGLKGRKRKNATSGEKDDQPRGPGVKRVRKRGKDSPSPLTSTKLIGKDFSPMFLDSHSNARVGERLSKAAKLIIESPTIRKRCTIEFEKETDQEDGEKTDGLAYSGDEEVKQGDGGSIISPIAKDVLSGIKPAALSPLHERPFGTRLDVFSLNKISSKDDDEDDGRPMSAVLFLTFSSGVALPTKSELVEKYHQFGSLNEEETDVQPDSLCAQVVFTRKSDGEQAFDHMATMNSENHGVHFCMRYVPRGSKIRELDGSLHSKTSPESSKVNNGAQPLYVDDLKQKLEMLISKLNNEKEAELSVELKTELRDEMADLLKKLRY